MSHERARSGGLPSRPRSRGRALVGAWAALATLASCDGPTPERASPSTSGPARGVPSASATSPASGSAGTAPTASAGDASVSLRELLAGGARLDALPLEDTTPGRDFDPDLERAIAAGGHVEIADGSHALLARAAQASLADLRLCYGRGLSLNPTLSGSVWVRTATQDGRLAPPASVSGDVPDGRVLACVLAELHRSLGWAPPAQGLPAPAASEGAPHVELVMRPSKGR